ncbi:hypothetical protein BCR44DRAFT_1426691 [Catenaria anguillulae PL171]|uniref:IC97/Casc1 N-terminal domain-containing protein n=1 Tax=Catenaria anguillulae PL171 TaxID=765915 RepID=A0A1Y2HZW7_9FUNG|nr:hypothetical protein BCR44DRAFT_1426691 [Catenaria anguillulae PL171]
MPAAAKKPKKKSKKELEAERMAMEEQRRKDEEVARLAEMAREKEREIAEQKDREERDALLDAEGPTHALESAQVLELRNEMLQAVQGIIAERDKKDEWEAYLKCSRIPNPLVEADVASYLTAFKEIPERPTFQEIATDLAAAEELHGLLEKYYARCIDHQQPAAARFATNIRDLRSAIDRKWDALTAHILQNSELFPRESTENLLVCQSFPPSITYCLWANFTKNPRHKAFDVLDSIHVTLPKALTLANVAIRVIHDRSMSRLRDLSLQHESSSAKRHIVLDGVLSFSLLELPELPKTADFWTVRPLISNDLSVRHVPFPSTRNVDEDAQQEDAAEVEGGDSLDSSGNRDDDGMVVSFSVGSGLFLHPLATVKWLTMRRDRANGLVQFKLSVLRPCALVQEAFWDFPPEHWKIRPVLNAPIDPTVGPVVRLTLTGKWTDLELDMSKHGVKLVRPTSDRVKEHMHAKRLQPCQFFMTLTRFGLSFASPHSLATIKQQSESESLDDECYWAMAAKCTSLAFACNRNTGLNSATLRVVTASHPVPDLVEKTSVLAGSESEPPQPERSVEIGVQLQSNSAPEANTPTFTVVANYNHVITTKARKLFYIAHPDWIANKWATDSKPHGSLYALLNDLVPDAPLPDWSLVSTVAQVLRITALLDESAPSR